MFLGHPLNILKKLVCQVSDETADSNVSHVSGSSEMDHIREMKESQVAVVMQEQAKEPAPSQQPPPHTNGRDTRLWRDVVKFGTIVKKQPRVVSPLFTTTRLGSTCGGGSRYSSMFK